MKIFEFYRRLAILAEELNRPVPFTPPPISFHGRPLMSAHPMPADFRDSKRRLMDLCRLLDSFAVDELDDDTLRAIAGAVKPLIERIDPKKLRRGSAGWIAYYRLRDKYKLDLPDFDRAAAKQSSFSMPNVQNLPIQSSAVARGTKIHRGVDLMYRQNILQTHDSAFNTIDFKTLEEDLAEQLLRKIDTQKILAIDTFMPWEKLKK